MTTQRRSVNIYDYPEHLNPFREEDNRSNFWTINTKRTRSNSFNFQTIKDFRSSIRLPRSRFRTENSSSLSQLNCYGTKTKNEKHETDQNQNFFSTLRKIGRSFSIRNKNRNSSNSLEQSSNDERQARYSTLNRQTETKNAQLRLSVTPLPRLRLHERAKSPDIESPISTSSSDGNNPFIDDPNDSVSLHSPSKPVTPARKKKRAPPPPPVRKSSLSNVDDITSTNKQDEDKSPLIIEKDIISNEDTVDSMTKAEDNLQTENHNVPDRIEQHKELKAEEMEKAKELYNEAIQEIESINSNSTLSLSSPKTSVSSETKLELQQQQQAIDDSSDLLELVNKLKMEVDKLTDDTNNNIISPIDKDQNDNNETNNFKHVNEQTYLRSEQYSSNRVKTDINILLSSSRQSNDNDDDDDVVCRTPMSPRLVRLRKDTEWIKQ